ncbi:hypothetical protein SRHO_G00097550 [Serrasalmus rhombeus]
MIMAVLIVRHTIRTGSAQAIRQRAYRTSPHMRAELDRQVQQLLDGDIIEESCSPWSSPVVLVKKKDGSYRFCIDFRKLNAVTIKDSYPLPRPADALDSLSGSCWFSTMDLASGYWQVELEPQDQEKSAFTTGHALYHFKVMPMGLTNAPPTFQRLMELVLRGLHWKECLIYLDDVLVFSRTFSQHLGSLEEVLGRFRSAGLKLKPTKCSFACSQVTFLGHVVSSQGLQPDAKNLDKVLNWPTPTTTTEVRAFVGLCSYYRRFIRNFSVIAAPLHALTQKGALFSWMPACEDAFQSLKHALTNPPIVAHPVFSQMFLLYTDASQDRIGAVLAQVQEQTERVIFYASHTLTPSQRKWSTYDRELWAIVWSVRHFKHFLAGTTFTIVTDHKPLLSLQKAAVESDPTGRRGRWILELGVYDYRVILCRKFKCSPHTLPVYQILILRYWPYMSRDIHKFCSECLPCQTRSSPTPHERAPLQSVHANCPFQSIAADITELPITSKGHRYVLVIMDYFTRYINLFPLKDQRAITVAQCIFEEYIRHHGIPETIHTDQGRQFDSDLMKQLCRMLGIEKTRTSPYHAQSDGMVERLNRTLKDQLAKYMSQSGGEWDSYLPQIELAYNSSVHLSTGFSPFFLVHGREPHLPVDILLKCDPALTSPTPGTPAAYANDLTTRLSQALGAAAQNSAAAKQHQKLQYDKKAVFHPHKAGDLVWLDDPSQRQNKLAPRWKGPFVILKRMDRGGSLGVTYEITDSKDKHSRRWVVHHNRLKAYKGTLPQEPVHSQEPAVSADAGMQPEPCHSNITALSGALPFCPPAPTYVPPRPSVQTGHVHVGSPSLDSPPAPVPPTDSQPSTSPMPVPSSSPGSPFPTVLAPLSTTRRGFGGVLRLPPDEQNAEHHQQEDYRHTHQAPNLQQQQIPDGFGQQHCQHQHQDDCRDQAERDLLCLVQKCSLKPIHQMVRIAPKSHGFLS